MRLAGGGLRDTTRIAGSDPKLWKTILEQNREEVLRALRACADELHGMERAIANLKAAGLLEPAALRALPLDDLAAHIRPSGTYQVKARRLAGLLGEVA